jgi:gliding motility-associated lipoprotein GldD
MNLKKGILALVISFICFACEEQVLPKPKAKLRLEYPKTSTSRYESNSFLFEHNALAQIRDENQSSFTLNYPQMKGSIFITYRKVNNNISKLLADAQKLSYEHAVKANDIIEQPFINDENKVYGMYYEVLGDAASQSQFYVTDSTRHFIAGSLYFYAKPNYDSIYPAAVYLQRDIRHIMESLRWK